MLSIKKIYILFRGFTGINFKTDVDVDIEYFLFIQDE